MGGCQEVESPMKRGLFRFGRKDFQQRSDGILGGFARKPRRRAQKTEHGRTCFCANGLINRMLSEDSAVRLGDTT